MILPEEIMIVSNIIINLIALKALKYFQKSLGYSRNVDGDEINLSSTHLNICALFSQIGNHELAYKHGKMSLKLLPTAYKRLKKSQPALEKAKVFEDQRLNLIMTLVRK
jgi:hypothetical protein